MQYIKRPQRIDNYYIARNSMDPVIEEPVWLRPKDFKGLHLPGPVVLCNGAFDLLHVGHMRVLFRARRGVIENHRHVPTKTLVVALDSDRKCAMKGPGRPILSFIERAAALAYMPVDYIVEIDTERDMYDLVKYLSPDLRVQGPDYLNRPTRFPYIRRCIVKDYSGMRTSEIIRRCKLVK